MRATVWGYVAAGILCGIVVALVTAAVLGVTPFKEIISVESKELKLVKAIYVDEYARKFVKYGIHYILEDMAKGLASKGGFFGPGDRITGGQDFIWLNVSNGVMSRMETDQDFIDLPMEFVPVDKNDFTVYYAWCNDTTDEDTCKFHTITEVLTQSEQFDIAKESLTNEFSIGTYAAQFTRYANFPPEITTNISQISMSEDSISISSDVNVIVRVGGLGGVNSTDAIEADAVAPLGRLMNAARAFSESTELQDAIQYGLDYYCSDKSLELSEVGDYISSLMPGSWDSDSLETNVTVTQPARTTKTCLLVDSTHLLGGYLKFKTQVMKCDAC